MLEARGRVGGRTEGGTHRGRDPGRARRPVARADPEPHVRARPRSSASRRSRPTTPASTWSSSGVEQTRMASKRGAVPKLNPFVLADLFQGMTRFKRLADKIPLDRPWTAPGAKALDNQTFETWILRNLRTPTARTYFRVATEAVFSAESSNLSALHALFYAHSGTDLEGLLSTDQGAQQDRIVGGSIRVSEAMAADLGDRVTPGQPGAPHRAGAGPGRR